ncbi:ABC transporter permease [Cellvibrio sp. OA-2007]|uniref:ABC transporter permease n=1 Tax=Cellvibrio sp. OA-2007 TaxID=529823 RepID=UPI000783B6A5|nr:ABC transporter permease [Cellvibrio sp. OA-2007]
MFNAITQIIVVTLMNLRNLPQRLGTSAVAVFGVACVVGVFIAVLSMASGFQRTMVSAGAEDVLILMRAGATSEMSSGMGYDQTQLIANLPGIAKLEGKPLSSPELFVIVDVPMRTKDTNANAPLRGVEPMAFEVRESFKIIEGRNFEPGKNELIVGRAAQTQFANLAVGSVVKFGQNQWTVVGAFEAGGGLAESELWCDAKILQNAYRRGNSYQIVRAKLDDKNGFAAVKDAIAADPKFNLDVKREADYLAEQSEPLSKFIKMVGYPLAFLMALGAIFGAVNTMYTSVSNRTREIATLRAIGFGSTPVAISTLVESLVLAVIGGLIGALIAYLVFNGYTVSTLNFASFSQVVFDFAVTPDLLIQGVVFAIVIGFIGGFFPAIRAARLPVATALREV